MLDGLTGSLPGRLQLIGFVDYGQVDYAHDPWLARAQPHAPQRLRRRARLVRTGQSGPARDLCHAPGRPAGRPRSPTAPAAPGSRSSSSSERRTPPLSNPTGSQGTFTMKTRTFTSIRPPLFLLASTSLALAGASLAFAGSAAAQSLPTGGSRLRRRGDDRPDRRPPSRSPRPARRSRSTGIRSTSRRATASPSSSRTAARSRSTGCSAPILRRSSAISPPTARCS